jgi:hypothetical protein
MACPHKNRIMQELFPANAAANTSVWAVLDGARDKSIYYMLRDSGLDYLCLYSGFLQRELQLAAPYIVELSQDGAFTRRLLEHAWGNSWGIFVTTRNGPNLRHHLRKFLRVRNEAGKILVFRYYDPRVMRVYLPTCWTEELKTVFGPVERYLMEDKTAQNLLEFKFDAAKLGQKWIALQDNNGQ